MIGWMQLVLWLALIEPWKFLFFSSSGFRDASRSYCMLSTCSSDAAKLWHGLWWVLLCYFICLLLVLFSLYKISAKIWDSKKWTSVFLFFLKSFSFSQLYNHCRTVICINYRVIDGYLFLKLLMITCHEQSLMYCIIIGLHILLY